MNKTDLVEVVAIKTGMTKKDAEAAVKAVNEAIAEALAAGDKVQLIGLRQEQQEKAATPRLVQR